MAPGSWQRTKTPLLASVSTQNSSSRSKSAKRSSLTRKLAAVLRSARAARLSTRQFASPTTFGIGERTVDLQSAEGIGAGRRRDLLQCVQHVFAAFEQRALELVGSVSAAMAERARLGSTVLPTASYGIAFAELPLEGAIERADQALYRAKETGRDRAVQYADLA